MAKKIVRGTTDVKTINNQDFDTNNVNDLLSDGQYNYIHRKKGKTEEYHNLTDNIKTISSDNTELLSVTNNNKTTNTATLHPKHDAQKEQVLESTRNTITINHGTNGTAEKTTVDTNPKKVLEHENLISNSQYVTIEHEQDTNISEIKTDNLVSKLNELNNKIPTSSGGRNLAQGTSKDWSKAFTAFSGVQNNVVRLYQVLTDGLSVGDTLKSRIVLKYTDIVPTSGQTATILMQGEGNVTHWGDGTYNVSSLKTISGSGEVVFEHEFKITADHLKNDYWSLVFRTDWIVSGSLQWKLAKVERGMFFTDWSPAPEDTQQQFNSLNSSLSQKQDVLTAGTGITIQGNTISASAPVEGTTLTIQDFAGNGFNAWKHVVTSGGKTLVTLSFQCNQAETVITGALKQQLENFIPLSATVSNGALSITRDGADIKLLNSAPSENVTQYGTFTFYSSTEGGGGENPK